MRIAIFSDVHSNWHALRAVARDMAAQKAEQIICLGDLVGYNARPKECLDEVRSWNIQVIRGNHDQYAAADTDLEWFNPLAREGIELTRRRLGPQDKEWLLRLPLHIQFDDFEITHASLEALEDWIYIVNEDDAAAHFEKQSRRLCFVGHTHYPGCFVEEKKGGATQVRLMRRASKTRLRKDCRYLVNVGSVGQPRDRNPKACYVLWDSRENSLQWRRVAYDIESAMEDNLQAGLAPELALRLSVGM
jgi:predicted phosphodiesterase